MYSSMSENESSVEISFGVEIEIIVWTWTWMDVRVPVKNNKHTTKHRAWGSGRWSGYRVLLDTVNACCWSRLAWTKKKKMMQRTLHPPTLSLSDYRNESEGSERMRMRARMCVSMASLFTLFAISLLLELLLLYHSSVLSSFTCMHIFYSGLGSVIDTIRTQGYPVWTMNTKS